MSLTKSNNGDKQLIQKEDKYTLGEIKPIAIEEDDYIEGLNSIIQKTYYPDLSRLKAHSEGFTYEFEDDIIQEKNDAVHEQLALLPKNDHLVQKLKRSTQGVTLADYQKKFTSEDNASFSELFHNEKSVRKVLLQRRYAVDADSSSATNIQPSKAIAWKERPNTIHTWNFQPRNSLMFYPQTSEPSALTRARGQHQKIDSSSTRLDDEFIKKSNQPSQDPLPEPAINRHEASINGYPLVGSNYGVTSRKSSTNFYIPETSRREKLHDLRLHSLKSQNNSPSTPGYSVVSSTAEQASATSGKLPSRLSTLTPAAKRLVAQSYLTASTRDSPMRRRLTATSVPKFSWTPTPRTKNPATPKRV
ncbi:stress response protein Bis1 [Schizosaccharomyces cryophilus OY26]|uniref:Stress response protein Bis1 n=1 Tax=Schizosaccharomyces cryophilus (strain OY26 / ATCC MYA-4695 / CBS 11777 / NBRC 106824 / NRRL Y48691) TaxID=653667 RepID=S9X860_SCHCR|nr:stress response protein Bis1 [Schizosaccharomyces cryophilus OY26]EPY49951.1 stress response protein Bis1 [Schizosaccharomyces cryophilus OY26]